MQLKEQVRDFWDAASCGEIYAAGATLREQVQAQAAARYALEPYIADFARFADAEGRDVLEIGVGMGADHARWALARPRRLCGVDLTPRAIAHTRARFEVLGLDSELHVGDAENLPFADDTFDLVYSWGVLHHSPDTLRAVREAIRVLRPGGTLRVMIYHSQSIVGYMLWLRYALLAGRPFRSLADIYAHHLESPGTKAYSVRDARTLFAGLHDLRLRPLLCFGDLLLGEAGQRHRGRLLSLARRLWPRNFIRRWLPGWGLFLLVEGRKGREGEGRASG